MIHSSIDSFGLSLSLKKNDEFPNIAIRLSPFRWMVGWDYSNGQFRIGLGPLLGIITW